MNGNRQTVAALLLALTALPFATSVVAADDGPVVNDYSDMGADYSGSDDSSKSKDSKSSASADSQKNDSAKKKTASTGGGADGKPYKVDCDGSGPCEVNEDVMVGYEQYGSHCLRCHGETAQGSTFAPSLVQRLDGMDQGTFTARVAGGVTRLDSTTGQYSIMPAWANNEEVMNHVQQLWSFLKARSDGALPAGRPEVSGGNKS